MSHYLASPRLVTGLFTAVRNGNFYMLICTLKIICANHALKVVDYPQNGFLVKL